jgi:hypothetical protein
MERVKRFEDLSAKEKAAVIERDTIRLATSKEITKRLAIALFSVAVAVIIFFLNR